MNVPHRHYTLIETCCGSAAFSLYMCGGKHSLMPYQGSKWRYRKQLAAIAGAMGFVDRPQLVQASDPGPWGKALDCAIASWRAPIVIQLLEGMASYDPFEVYEKITSRSRDDRPYGNIAAAEFLFLQRLSFSGKAVTYGTGEFYWNSPGFNKTSAYGTPATNRFGAVRPMLRSLLDVLAEYQQLFGGAPKETGYFEARRRPAYEPWWPGGHSDYLVYIDPPYQGTTGYGKHDLTRAQVIELANKWLDSGAAVMVSESEPLHELSGWNHTLISVGQTNKSPFKSKAAEWVTWRKGE